MKYTHLLSWQKCYQEIDAHVCIINMKLLLSYDINGTLFCFMCVCVCLFSEYAEALTNPIKHISQLHKRETQLAVLIEDSSEVRRIRA